jgi:hypothetical protein
VNILHALESSDGCIYNQKIVSLGVLPIIIRYKLYFPLTGVQKKGRRKFTEGWIEFKSKRVAKDVVANLNNQKVGGKRRSPNYECLWTMKYLRGLKWAHLTERLAYEKAVHQNRMRTEIAQVKRETNFYIESMEKSKKLKRKAGGTTNGWRVEQKPTDEEILQKKMKVVKKEDQVSHIVNLFNPSNTD